MQLLAGRTKASGTHPRVQLHVGVRDGGPVGHLPPMESHAWKTHKFTRWKTSKWWEVRHTWEGSVREIGRGTRGKSTWIHKGTQDARGSVDRQPTKRTELSMACVRLPCTTTQRTLYARRRKGKRIMRRRGSLKILVGLVPCGKTRNECHATRPTTRYGTDGAVRRGDEIPLFHPIGRWQTRK